MPKINKGAISHKPQAIPTPEEIHQELVSFSFKYLVLDHGKFALPDTGEKTQYLGALFNRLKQISTMTCQEFRQAGKALRSHAIDWGRTSEQHGFTHLSEQLQECQPWQFSLAREELGRVHGFWIGKTFHAVWVDHDHQLYSGK